jgi:hypothetical protein
MKNSRKMGMATWVTAICLFFLAGIGSLGTLQAAALSDAEKADLIFIREEEKLARDVYLTLYNKWGTGIFENIAASEQIHMDAIKTLLDRYGIPDPAEGRTVGDFTNEELGYLYTDFMEYGGQSLIGAMEVGVTIEETDIKDLQDALSRTMHRDVSRVYNNLLNGSYNHLGAFTYQLTKLGVTLEP